MTQDDEIELHMREEMRAIADILQEYLNGPGVKIKDSKVGFLLLAFNIGETSRANYISNCERPQMIQVMQKTIERFEGYEHDQTDRTTQTGDEDRT